MNGALGFRVQGLGFRVMGRIAFGSIQPLHGMIVFLHSEASEEYKNEKELSHLRLPGQPLRKRA